MRIPLAIVAAAFALAPMSRAQAEPEIALGTRVWARSLSANAWLIRSVTELEGFGAVESNAVLVTGVAGSVLIDTPATDEQTAPVLAWAANDLRRPVRHVIFTHWHADRMGGIGAARAQRIPTHAFGETRTIAREKGRVVPEHELRPAERLDLAGIRLEPWYPGHGHTVDNLVVWLPGDALLVAGCFVKAVEATTLGNVREIDAAQWATGVAALRRRYPEPRIVVPGHGDAGGPEILAHTAALLAADAGTRGTDPAAP